MNETECHATHAWERRELPILYALPYVLLVVATAMAVGIDHGHSQKLAIDLAGAAAAALWMLWFITLHPQWAERRRLMAFYFAVSQVIAAVLVINDPIFGFFSWTGYIWVFRLLTGRLRAVGVAVVATITGTSQHGGLPGGSLGSWITWVAIVALNCFVSGAIAWIVSVRDRQYALRIEAIEALTEANAKLEASMRENEGLHEQLLAGAREAGILDERQRMAREIHDTLAQGLVGIITQLEAAAQGGPAAQRHTRAALDLARDSLAEARRSVQALAPAELERVRLPDAIANVASRWSSLSGVPASMRTTGTPVAVRPEIEVALLRAAQEALANVAKYAEASTVALTLSYMDDVVSLDVRDDGVGFRATPPANGYGTANGGFGLTAMRQRIEGLGGALAIESDPESGSTIAASVPIIRVPGSHPSTLPVPTP